MTMKMEHSEHEEGQQQAEHHPAHAPVERERFMAVRRRDCDDSMGELMKDAHTQHEATDHADQYLHASMRQSDQQGDRSPQQGRQRDQTAINKQQEKGRRCERTGIHLGISTASATERCPSRLSTMDSRAIMNPSQFLTISFNSRLFDSQTVPPSCQRTCRDRHRRSSSWIPFQRSCHEIRCP